jgi:hypothetical protein
MAFPPPELDANVGGPILDPGDHPGHHNALAAAVNDIVEHVGSLGASYVITSGTTNAAVEELGLPDGTLIVEVN